MKPDRVVRIDDSVWPVFNRASFDQDKVVSWEGYQYVPYWSADETLMLARRNLDDHTVQTLRFPYTLTINPRDGHRNTVVGISPADGRLHLSWDHHNNDLRYTKSRAGFLTDPPEAMSLDDFEPRQPLAEGAPQRVTYPRFFNAPDERLFFIYRTGSSGSGDSVLSKYDAATGTWEVVATCLFSKQGTYAPWENSTSRNAYLHDVLFDPRGRLHVSWVYRETGKSWASNHDLHYAWSDDEGLTWRNSAGDPIADLTQNDPIALDDPGIVVREIPVYSWLMNQCAMTVDSKGRPHVATFHMAEPFVPEVLAHNPPEEVLDRLKVHHYWREEDGTWKSSGPIDDPGGDGRQRRPNIVADPHDDIVIYWSSNAGYRATVAREATGYAHDVPFGITGTEFGEVDSCKHDRRRLAKDGILTFAAEPAGRTEERAAIALVDFDLDKLVNGAR